MQTLAGFVVVAIVLGGFVGLMAAVYRAGRQREKADQAARDDATENLIAQKRDELATASEDDLERRLRRWQ